MNKINISILLYFITFSNFSQIIPYGVSSDSLLIITPPNTTIYAESQYYNIYYYKPSNYDSINSPILWYIHGSGSTGAEGPASLSAMAERKNALIVAPTMHIGWYGWAYVTERYIDTIADCVYIMWSTETMKQIYRHVLQRENRNSISTYLTGFSQGGQFASRYMLIRQFAADSIPIRMAVSVSPANYTLCTDTFNNTPMLWEAYRCGLSGNSGLYGCFSGNEDNISVDSLICNSHVKQYYNENYGVLVGTLDTVNFISFCPGQGGQDRYERAVAFYNFSDTNAITRGTTLKWVIDSVPGVGHNGYALYQTPAAGDSIPIAERMLFETPYHPVPDFSPKANFTYLPATLIAQFYDNSQNTNGWWFWDFGDGSTSIEQNPLHNFNADGTYFVCLTVGNNCSSDTYCDSIAIQGTGINDKQTHSQITIQTNPFNSQITLKSSSNISSVKIQNILGQKIFQSENLNTKNEINLSTIPSGIYFLIVEFNSQIQTYKIIKL